MQTLYDIAHPCVTPLTLDGAYMTTMTSREGHLVADGLPKRVRRLSIITSVSAVVSQHEHSSPPQ
jgi:hypothetical protein